MSKLRVGDKVIVNNLGAQHPARVGMVGRLITMDREAGVDFSGNLEFPPGDLDGYGHNLGGLLGSYHSGWYVPEAALERYRGD